MARKQFYSVLVSLNNICKIHANKQNYITYIPKVNLYKRQTIDQLHDEIHKLCTYLRAPEHSYLNKFDKYTFIKNKKK
jgi:hypothetical protein